MIDLFFFAKSSFFPKALPPYGTNNYHMFKCCGSFSYSIENKGPPPNNHWKTQDKD